MNQGRIKALSISLIAHAALLYAISKTTNYTHKSQPKDTPVIRSYIYKPKPTIEPKIIEPQPSTIQPPEQAPSPQVKALDTKQSTDVTKEQTQTSALKESDTLDSIRPPQKLLQQKSKTLNAKSISRKALEQLSQINEFKDKYFVEEQTREAFRHRSPSVLDAEPVLVPRSNQQLMPDQKKAQNTMRYSDDLSIIKGDNGRCAIEQDLSNIGMEGVKAISGFNCGESKFDASFRQHMEKVRKKIGK